MTRLLTHSKRLIIGLVALSTLVIVVTVVSIYLAPKPDLHRYTSYSRALLDKNGELLRISLASDDRYRLFQSIDDISPSLIQATLLYEDQHFYKHVGVDFSAILRAFWSTYVVKQHRVGASTITMQVARLRWKIPSSTISGKFLQIYRAIQLSHHYSKKEILEAYFNLASYGQNVEGIGAASLVYFNKTPDRLTWLESLTLSVVPQNPNKRAPGVKGSWQYIRDARERLFDRWHDTYPSTFYGIYPGVSPDASFEDISDKKSLLDLPMAISTLKDLPFKAPHFSEFTLAELPISQTGIIATSLDLRLQRRIEAQIQNYITRRSREGITNASALLVNYQTNKIEAMVGSADFFSQPIDGQVNGALAKRSPGSALKPFVYALAMDEGLIHPMTMLRDSPRRYGGFSPENFDKKFLGPVFAKTALIESRNVPAVDLQAQLSQSSFYHFLEDGGVKGLKAPSFYGLALALGGGEVSMLELASLYSGLARGGEFKPLGGAHTEPQQLRYLISPEASFLTLDILRQNPAPGRIDTNTKNPQQNDIAWKTGTSWAFRDAWAVGVSGPYVLAVWVGNFSGEGNPVFVGRTAAGPLLHSIFSTVFPNQGWRLEDQFNLNALNLTQVDVCASTGDLSGKHCPQSVKSWFIPGVSPINVSTVHRQVAINKNTGLRSCGGTNKNTELKVYEFWPSDFLHLFRQAGISLKTPPVYEVNCDLGVTSSSGQIPVIISPLSSIEYAIPSGEDNTIEFQASVDSDVTTLFWFVNNQYVGQVPSQSSLSWAAKPGVHNITVVDDLGRSQRKNIRVIRVR